MRLQEKSYIVGTVAYSEDGVRAKWSRHRSTSAAEER
jgi:hypothetical protein